MNLHKLERVGSSVLGALMVAGGLKRRSIGGLAAVLTGSGLLYRGISGHCHVYQALGISTARRTLTDAVAEASRERRVQRIVTVDKPAAELYALWRDPATLRQVMAPFANLSPAADEGIRWSLRSPLGRLCVWTSQVVEEREGELLRWESIEGSKMIAGGMLRLAPALGNRGTRVSLSLRFEPPPGLIGHALFSTLRVVPNTISRKALQRFKSLAETGEIPTTEGSPSALREADWTDDPWAHGNDRRDVVRTGLGVFSIGLACAELVTPRQLAAWAGLPDRPMLLRCLGLRELASGIGILSNRQRGFWLWSRVAGDAMDLALLGVALRSSEANRARAALVAGAVSGVTALDVLSAWRHSRAQASWSVVPSWSEAHGGRW